MSYQQYIRKQSVVLISAYLFIAWPAIAGSGPPASPAPETKSRSDTQLGKDCLQLPALQALPACQELVSHIDKSATLPLAIAARIHSQLGIVLWELGQYDASQKEQEKALGQMEQAKGKLAPEVAQLLNNLAVLCRTQGRFDEAKSLLLRARDINKNASGQERPKLAATLANLAMVYEAQGQWAEAESLLLQGLDIYEKVIFPNCPESATTLVNLAVVYKNWGRLKAAALLLEQARDIQQKAPDKDQRELTTTLVNLAVVYKAQGRLLDAESLLMRARDMVEKALGPESPVLATTLGNLALIYKAQGRLQDAESLLLRAAEIDEKKLGKFHPELATTLADLAVIYEAQGRLEEAEPLLLRARDIDKKSLGENHPGGVSTLVNLALVYKAQGRLAEAEPLLLRAWNVQQKKSKGSQAELAVTINNLALVYKAQGRLTEAERLLLSARGIEEKTLGNNHPELATALVNLALVYQAQGRRTEAEPLLLRALDIEKNALGDSHPELATTYANLASLALAQNRPTTATAYRESSLIIEELALLTSHTEARAQNLLGRVEMRANQLITYGLPILFPGHQATLSLTMRTALLRKGRALDVGILANSLLQSQLITAQQKQRYAQMQQLLAQRAILLDRRDDSVASPQQVGTLLYQAQQIEQALAQEVGAPSNQRVFSPKDILERVADRISPGSVLVEVVLGGMADYGQIKDWRKTVEHHYIALILFHDRRIEAVDLGRKKEVEEKVTAHLRVLEKPDPAVESTARALYEQVFQKIEKRLGAVRRLIVSPDGLLQLVPWETFHDGTQYMLDKYLIQYVTSGRDLLRKQNELPLHPALVLADPDAYQLGKFRLTSAREWSKTIAQSLHVNPVLDDLANEQCVSATQSPWVIHLAAHGVFRQDLAPLPNAQSVGHAQKSDGLLMAHPVVPQQDHETVDAVTPDAIWNIQDAMHRSALALTPGPRAATDSHQDGWLTGDDVRNLNLRGTQLVTLLACESGRGAVSIGQGIYGLRRAFLLAGAETVVSALWSVEEDSASALIGLYYEKILNKGEGRATAMHETMQELRKKNPHPHYWAPFIVVGLDGPLRPPVHGVN